MSASVLVVDDQELVRAVLARILQQDGYAVACAGDADEAITALVRHRPAVVLADADVPGPDDDILIDVLVAVADGGQVVLMADAARPWPRRDLPVLTKPFDTAYMLDLVAELTTRN